MFKKFCFVVLLFSVSCAGTTDQKKETEVISYARFDREVRKPGDKLKIINFWATWCKPCLEELPAFSEVYKANKEDTELYLISMDFADELNAVEAMRRKMNLPGHIKLLNETNYDSVMPLISKEWSGAIPATLVVDRNGKEHFYEQSFTKKELSDLITSLRK